MDETGGPLFDRTRSAGRLQAVDVDLIPRLRGICDPERLRSVFQPIFRSSSGALEGCEALIRLPVDSGFTSPEDAFSEAARVGLLLALESASLLRHLAEARGLVGALRLFLNVSAPLLAENELGTGWLLERVREAGLFPTQVVIEIPEIVRIRDSQRFSRQLEPFRREGFQIAIDDFGAGYTNLRMITDLSPDFVKVDRVFIDGIASHARKRILVEGVTTLCHRVNCGVIAEGIELASDLETCLSAGVDYLQGFFFARPVAALEAFAAPDLALSRPRVRADSDLRRLLVAESPLPLEVPVGAALRRFAGQPRARALPIVDGVAAVGLLTRQRAAEVGGDAETPLGRFVGPAGLDAFDWIPEAASIEEAAELVRRRPETRRFEPIVVVGPDRVYRGLLEIDALLAELARLNVELSNESDHLTGLPGQIVFERTVARALTKRGAFCVVRLELRRLRHFNDRYGFLRGDDLLLRLAGLLKERVGVRGGTLIASLGGDEFAYVDPAPEAEETALGIIRSFDRAAAELHDTEDAEAGSFVITGRRGEPERVPLVGVAASLVVYRGEPGISVRSLLESCDELLRAAKVNDESTLAVNRRALTEVTRPPSGTYRSA